LDNFVNAPSAWTELKLLPKWRPFHFVNVPVSRLRPLRLCPPDPAAVDIPYYIFCAQYGKFRSFETILAKAAKNSKERQFP
jgi:hypothetical protein